MQNSSPRFPDLVRFRAPSGLFAALALAANRRHQTVSEMVRQLVLRELQRDGLRLGTNGTTQVNQENQP